jgi:hypothetical protein
VHGGKTFADPDAFIRVGVGREVTPSQLLSDWVLVHEMIHLALADPGEMHAWLSEGIATYVEGVARVHAGTRSEADVWTEELRAMVLGLQDALRAVLRASGGLAAGWPIERVLSTGDAAVGTRTLEELYAQMKDRPYAPDLVALWRQLGVSPNGETVRFDDQAPLAAVRRAIMRTP